MDAPARMSLGEPEAERTVSKKAAAPMQTEGLMKDEEPESASTGKTGEAPSPDLSKVQARRNLNETAFFYPSLLTGPDGSVKIAFKMPEALTKWHFMGFAHGKNLESGFIEEHAVTQKDLMVQPNPPRFLREGDAIEFCIKVTNMADKEINGSLRFTLADPVSEKPLDKLFKTTRPTRISRCRQVSRNRYILN